MPQILRSVLGARKVRSDSCVARMCAKTVWNMYKIGRGKPKRKKAANNKWHVPQFPFQLIAQETLEVIHIHSLVLVLSLPGKNPIL